MTPSAPIARPDSDAPRARVASTAPFGEFMNGEGRTPEFYDDSWPAISPPSGAPPIPEKRPE